MFRFGLVGIANTVLSYLLYAALVYLGVQYLWAATISFVCGTAVSYTLNSKFTFGTSLGVGPYIRFFVVSLMALAGGLGLLYVCKEYAALNAYAAQIVVVFVRFPIVYWVSRRFVFSPKSSIVNS